MIPYKDNDKIKVIFDLFKTVILKPRNRHGGKGIRSLLVMKHSKIFKSFVNEDMSIIFILKNLLILETMIIELRYLTEMLSELMLEKKLILSKQISHLEE